MKIKCLLSFRERVAFQDIREKYYPRWLVCGQSLLCKAKSMVNYKLTSRCGRVLNMSQNTQKITFWLGGESGQRKRYLRLLQKELAAELGPDWRNVIELARDS